jgi:hypothetical protein
VKYDQTLPTINAKKENSASFTAATEPIIEKPASQKSQSVLMQTGIVAQPNSDQVQEKPQVSVYISSITSLNETKDK